MRNKHEYEEQIQKMQEHIDNLELAVNLSYDSIHLLDKDGYTILINPACSINEGLDPDVIQGKTVHQLVEEGYLSESVTLKVLEKKEPCSIIQHVKSGKDMLVTGMPIYNEDNEIVKVLVNSRDITELNRLQKRLAETERRFQTTQTRLMEMDLVKNLPPEIICRSPAMKKVLRTATIVSKVDSNVLITGESGTGKGVVSKYIHENSKRAGAPYIKIDCGSIPEALFESELFGYEGGAFTSASSKGKIGLMELANGGTLFLDEIGEISPSCQSKLLRAIQDREILRVGGKEMIPIDIRIISATNRDLEEMMKMRMFREDLFYRLNVVPIHLPPLRERQEDIQELVLNVIRKLCEKYGFQKRIHLEAMELLLDYPWKGNVRELENLIERIAIMTEKPVIGVEDLPSYIQKSEKGQALPTHLEGSLGNLLNAYERSILEKMIDDGKTPMEMARVLKVDVTTVRRKLGKYQINPELGRKRP